MTENRLPVPIYDRILVKVNTDDEVSPGGIILPKVEEGDNVLRGEVLSVGEGRYTDSGQLLPMTVKAGMVIAFDREDAASIKVSGTEYFLLNESSVYAIL
jgi:chaperonin GroES